MAIEIAPLQNLSILADSLSSVIESVPSIEAFTPPTDGLSILDTKNELLLSYLQNLVFLVLLKLRSHSSVHPAKDDIHESFYDEIVKNLVSHRLYLEKGVRPIESRLKYQLDKLLLAASEASSQSVPQPSNRKSKPQKHLSSASSSVSASASDNEPTAQNPTISDLSHRPNLSAFTRHRQPSPPASSSKRNSSNVYRPPRITPTALPTTDRPSRDASTRKRKNAMLDTFIREELSSAPVAEPSIGADSGLRGRDAQRERERKEYEELRLVRLPSEGGKKGKKGKSERERMMGGGFEEVLGGAGEVLGEAVKGGKRRKVAAGGGSGGQGMRVGEAWERRKRAGVRGLGGKKR